MDTLNLYFDFNDINKYIHSRLSQEDKEKHKDTIFVAYESAVNKKDLSVDIHIAAIPTDVVGELQRDKIDIDEFVSAALNDE